MSSKNGFPALFSVISIGQFCLPLWEAKLSILYTLNLPFSFCPIYNIRCSYLTNCLNQLFFNIGSKEWLQKNTASANLKRRLRWTVLERSRKSSQWLLLTGVFRKRNSEDGWNRGFWKAWTNWAVIYSIQKSQTNIQTPTKVIMLPFKYRVTSPGMIRKTGWSILFKAIYRVKIRASLKLAASFFRWKSIEAFEKQVKGIVIWGAKHLFVPTWSLGKMTEFLRVRSTRWRFLRVWVGAGSHLCCVFCGVCHGTYGRISVYSYVAYAHTELHRNQTFHDFKVPSWSRLVFLKGLGLCYLDVPGW